MSLVGPLEAVTVAPMGAELASGGAALRRIMETPGALRTLFQPIVCVGADGWVLRAFECLTRGPAGTPYAEAVPLFSAARGARVEPELDRACVTVALETAAAFGIAADLYLNVHPTTLDGDATFPDFVALTAACCGVACNRLTVEVTEHRREYGAHALARALRAFRAHGIRVAFDDVGAAAMDHRAVQVCRPDVVKLDGRLFRAARLSAAAQREVGSIVAHARRLGVCVIAEGVEQPGDARMAYRLGIELAQGRLFCGPLRPEFATRADALVPVHVA